MRVGVVTSVCVEHDAISSAATGQAAQLVMLSEVEDVRLFTMRHERSCEVPVTEVSDAWALRLDPDFRACDVIIFHWGILNPLLDTLWLIDPSRQRAVVHFHNVTAPDLVPDTKREIIEESLRQITLIDGLDVAIWTFSEFNRQTLLEWGVDEDRISFVPFAVSAPRPLRQRRIDDGLHVLNVGRLVPAKGIHTLIEAAAIVRQSIEGPFTVTICGDVEFSDIAYADLLRSHVGRRGLTDVIRFMPNLTDNELWEQYELSNVLVSPSLHEGFCVPVLEAYLAGAHVIGTSAGNLPFVVQPPDPVVEPENPTALAEAMLRVACARLRDDPAWAGRVGALLDRYSPANERRALTAALHRLRSGQPSESWPEHLR